MPDALDSIMKLVNFSGPLSRRVFNVTGFTCSARDFELEIRKAFPDFVATYNPDPLRQAIADSWPDAMDDSAFRREVSYAPKDDLQHFSQTMIAEWKNKLGGK